MGLYVRMLAAFEEVRQLKQFAFKEIVPRMHFEGGQRGNDWVNCSCNGVLMKSQETLKREGKKNKVVSTLHPHTKEILYPMSREAQDKWCQLHKLAPFDYDSTLYLGLGGSLHLGCHKVSHPPRIACIKCSLKVGRNVFNGFSVFCVTFSKHVCKLVELF